MKALALLIILLASTVALAGKKGGNGGETVVCRSPQGNILSIELLDSFESSTFYGLKLDLGDPSLTVEQKVELALRRIDDRDVTRMNRYLKWLKNFFKGVEWTNETLPATPEIDPSIFKKGCSIEQIAIQKSNTDNAEWYEFGPAVQINEPLWKAMDKDQQAALVLHEIIYHEAILGKIESAEPIRHMNSLFYSGKISTLSAADYSEKVWSIHGRTLNIFGLNVVHPAITSGKDWKTNSFFPSGWPRGFRLIRSYQSQSYNIQGKSVQLREESYVYFHDGTRILSYAQPEGGQKLSFTSPVGEIKGRMYEARFFPNGLLELAIGVDRDQWIPTGGGWSLYGVTNVWFSEKHLRFAYVGRGVRIQGPGLDLTTSSEGYLALKEGQLDHESVFDLPQYDHRLYLDGKLELYGQSVEVKELGYYRGFGTTVAKLPVPTTLKLKGGAVTIQDYVSLFNGNKLNLIFPAADFKYVSRGITVPIAATTRCTFFSTEIQNRVVFNREGELEEFVLAEKTTINGREYEKNRKVSIREDGFVWSDDVCGK